MVSELALGYVHFQFEMGSGKLLLWSLAGARIVGMVDVGAVPKFSRRQVEQKLCADSNELLESIKNKYFFYFKKLVESIKNSGADVFIMYIPMYGIQESHCKDVFYQLTERVGVEIIDLSSEFSKYEAELIYFLPDDIHISRLGHQLIAKKLFGYLRNNVAKNIETFQFYRSAGILRKNINKIRMEIPGRPYRLVTNAQGYRMDEEIDFDKSRVLVLGDSFTYGAHTSNVDIYTSVLNKMMPEKQIINAGVSGYGIDREWRLYYKSARYLAADVVVIQVSDNDISDFMGYFNRANSSISDHISAIEAKFIKSLN